MPYSHDYWVCNVSTCNRKRVGFVFCSVTCWDSHLPLMNHREAWAEERKSPTQDEWEKELRGENRAPRTRKSVAESPAIEPAKQAGPPKTILRRR